MKKWIELTAVAVLVFSCLTACTEEYFDTFVEWGFADDAQSEIVNGLETLLPSAVVIFNAFDDTFLNEYDDLGMSHEALMRAQRGRSAAIKNAKATAEKAHAMIEKGHTCPANYLFVVRIKYDSDEYETVWSHDYRPE